jgi:quaternary ammonium compound-resistance protein SugE
MSWIYLFLAGILEIVWAIGLKYTEGFTRLWPSVITIAVAWLSFYLLAVAVKTIPVGTGYAIWTGIGAAGVALLGMLLFGEPATVSRFLFLGLIIVGIVGLKLSAGSP